MEGPVGVDTSGAARQTAGGGPAKGRQVRSIAMIVIVDIAAPLLAYLVLRSAGLSAWAALLLSGVFPALKWAIGILGHRRIDLVGVLVLAGIIVGTVLGLVTHNSRLVLVEGSVPTAVFGAGCLFSLRARRPLMYSLALEFTGPDTSRGREMTGLWQYEGFRRVFRNITVVWGAGFLFEAALRVLIVFSAPPGTALAVSKVTPWLFMAVFSAWTVAYGTYHRKKGERMAAAAQVTPPANHARPAGERG